MALAESCIGGGVGAEIDLSAFPAVPPEVLLFNESQSRIVLSVRRENATAALSLAEWRGVPARRLGFTGGQELRIKAAGGAWGWAVEDLREPWWNSIRKCMEDAV